MSEYDYSPQAAQQYQRTQQRISNWATDTAANSHKYKSPFVPRSDVQDSYHTSSRDRHRSPSTSRHSSSSRSSSKSHPKHDRRQPQRSYSHDNHEPVMRSPLRANTLATMTLVSPNDSISQVMAPTSRRGHHARAQSHSPSRHTSTRARNHRRTHTSGGGGGYVVQVQSPHGVYQVNAAQPGGGGYFQPQPQAQMQMQQPMQQVQQPAAWIIDPRTGKVQAAYANVVVPQAQQPAFVYPPAPHPVQEHHGGWWKRLLGSSSTGSGSDKRHGRTMSRSKR
ncbi:unnamed protein product [Mycena citricolor]|uniref:Uncharacterized protein n=1 Tax=Mycena citricolor TaxID=2018698 RepID=A0AAD2GS21_9AGAR|nr:unnamed protein product [Mycena citricolor]